MKPQFAIIHPWMGINVNKIYTVWKDGKTVYFTLEPDGEPNHTDFKTDEEAASFFLSIVK